MQGATAPSRREFGKSACSSDGGFAWLSVGLSVLSGVWLRILGADGDLWLDEIWTLDLIAPAVSAADIFFNTPHANNHYLNSLWLWLLGADAPVLVMRGASIVMGALSIIAATLAMVERGNAALTLSAALFASSYFFVHYGSEARGYSGMILCVLVAKAALDRLFDAHPPAWAWWIFGAAISTGGFFHVTMTASALALGLSALLQMFEEARLRRGLLIAALAALACAPFLAVLGANMASPNFKLGNVEAFSSAALLQGLAGMARATVGWPEFLDDATCVLASATLAILALSLLPRSRRFFPIVAIFVIPALYALMHAPTQSYPRFHMITAIGLLLLMSEAGAILLARGGAQRAFACAALVMFGFSQMQSLTRFYLYARGHYAAAVRFMTQDGSSTYTTDWIAENPRVIVHASRGVGARLNFVPIGELCANAPDWLIRSTFVADPTILETTTTLSSPSGDCTKNFVLARQFQTWGLSGVNWWVYRREN